MRHGIQRKFFSTVGIVMLCTAAANASAEDQQAILTPVECTSAAGERQHCAANTSSGILMRKSTGPNACLLGKTWGYDDAGVWVQDGCSGEFLVTQTVPSTPVKSPTVVKTQQQADETQKATSTAKSETESAAETAVDTSATASKEVAVTTASTDKAAAEPEKIASKKEGPSIPANDVWGTYTPGNGFLVGRNDYGELSISGYALVRYINQMPAEGTFVDHLGREQTYDGRNDVYSHRVLVWLKGWMGDPRLIYNIAFWTVNTTDQDALFGNIGYQFDEKFNLYAGINGNPGVRSTQGSHPYWLGHDRVMADEYFRPFFSQGIWANGELMPGFWYNAMVGNNSSILGTTAVDLDRNFTTGASVWWMPTTHEFGPRGGYGDWEMHENLATRFGISTTWSPEQRYSEPPEDSINTSLKLADSLNLFGTGSLAPDVTVLEVDYAILSFDAGFKYQGFFLQAEYFTRWLDNFVADGLLPVDEIIENGFYIQTAFFPVPKKLELYAATSQIYGDSDAGFDNSSEYLIGMNWYPWNTRNHRLNLQLIDVNFSPVGSTFGYYTAGQSGTTASAAFSIFF